MGDQRLEVELDRPSRGVGVRRKVQVSTRGERESSDLRGRVVRKAIPVHADTAELRVEAALEARPDRGSECLTATSRGPCSDRGAIRIATGASVLRAARGVRSRLFRSRDFMLPLAPRSASCYPQRRREWLFPAAIRDGLAMMDALEHQILVSPEDDRPREQLANALIARGDPRGEFIALQLEVARIRRSADVSAARWGGAFRRATQLLEEHRASWLPPLPPWATDPYFRRGFVEGVTVDAERFLRDAPILYAVAPIRRLAVRGAGPIAEQLFTQEALDRLISLNLRENGLGDAGTIALAASPHAARLRWLDLEANDIGAAGLDAVLASPYLRQLAFLAFRWNLVPSPEEGYAVENGISSILPTEETDAAEAKYGPRPWLRAPSLHMYAYPPEPDDVV